MKVDAIRATLFFSNLIFIFSIVWTQEQNTPADDVPVEDEGDYFLIPKDEYDDEENVATFVYKNQKYLVVNYQLKYIQAKMKCKYGFHGRLTTLEELERADFLAEALSETNMPTDTLWLGAEYRANTKKWVWVNGQVETNFDYNTTRLININTNFTHDRECMGFGRSNHNLPELRPLNCTVKRGFVCQYSSSGVDGDDSVHPGWIKLGKRLYKIFNEPVPYEEVSAKCFRNDPDSDAAVITTYDDAQALGRYLLIGRPSLENAWIGARWWSLNAFYFEQEDLMLSNKTDSSGYPPWRNNTIEKPAGCLLLDRHLSNITYFVEARCKRYRPYICYKKAANATVDKDTDHTDILVGDLGYRLELEKASWDKAAVSCVQKYKKRGKLAEPKDYKNQIYSLLYAMGGNKTTVQHVWIGGRYLNGKWEWISNHEAINITGIDFISNVTDSNYIYTADVEAGNICLNLDRENHLTPLLYGTVCDASQPYICQFSREDLIAIEKEEDGIGNPKNIEKTEIKKIITGEAPPTQPTTPPIQSTTPPTQPTTEE